MKPVFWAATIALTTAMGCERRPDTAENVRKALEQANMQTVEVAVVDDEAQVVHLQGTVGTLADRTRADEIATAVVGTSGRVLNDLTVEGLTDRRRDDPDGRITDVLDERLDQDAVLRERDVNIRVTDGMVDLTGEVRTAEEKNRAERIVKAAPGVKDVVNGLQIRDER